MPNRRLSVHFPSFHSKCGKNVRGRADASTMGAAGIYQLAAGTVVLNTSFNTSHKVTSAIKC